jgi:hypothetical protein
MDGWTNSSSPLGIFRFLPLRGGDSIEEGRNDIKIVANRIG